MKATRKILALLLSALLAAACLACAAEKSAAPETENDDWAYIEEKGTLIIGFTDYAPMNYYDESGEFVGFDTEFARALCEKLGLTPEFIEIDWDSKEFELSSRNIDCIWNGLTVTEERRANMDFTNSYLINRQVIVVKAERAAEFAGLDAFAGKTVAAEEGSAGAAAVAADMPEASFIGVGAQTDALLEVMAGTSDAAVVDLTLADAMVGEGTDYAALAALDITMMNEEYAIGLRVGSSATARFNEAMAELYAEGFMAELAEKYELSELLIAA
ncbi:MAG: transporter substrate-binding domain-containing protein [Clostridia bacterium]|nr:transporter substrate-binding domain-containing protein [Clostridia bacterium]